MWTTIKSFGPRNARAVMAFLRCAAVATARPEHGAGRSDAGLTQDRSGAVLSYDNLC